ncbi:hypothetical protein IFM89_033828 [Coptis chinensis]|uniref:F-box domain-containing protein n=1 Tax=Coptis chinensis TaxID=261450 RepID=A0A835HTT0_9MAGN|nr:hypothetical protein IFM89_033828 [Coptis chinensis]
MQSKEEKLCCSSDQEMDKISWLPDPIRSHIVSFLPMKDAIRSKILSRRWRYVCSSLSNLKFDQIEFEKSNSEIRDFRDFVDETLLSHDGSDIQRFSLKINLDDAYIYARRVSAWISFALQHNVQILILGSVESSALLEKLPCSLFTCNTLRVFSLVGIPGPKWPTITKFPVLRSLRIGFITSFDDENVIAKLFSSCTFPVLEELTVDHCIFESLDTLSISISSLKFLYLRYYTARSSFDDT